MKKALKIRSRIDELQISMTNIHSAIAIFDGKNTSVDWVDS